MRRILILTLVFCLCACAVPVETTPPPTEALTPTILLTETPPPDITGNLPDVTALSDLAPGVGGVGELVANPFDNQRQAAVNTARFGVVHAGNTVSVESAHNGSDLCFSAIPASIYDPDHVSDPKGDLLVSQANGVGKYGFNQVLAEVLVPHDTDQATYTCVLGYALSDNPDFKQNTLRMLLLQTSGGVTKVAGSMQAGFSISENIQVLDGVVTVNGVIQNWTLFPDMTITTPTPEQHFSVGMTAEMTMADCNKLEFANLDTQMPALVAASQKAYETIGNDVNYEYAFYFDGIGRSDITPWSYADIKVYITDPATVSCNILHTDHGDELSLTVPMKAPGSDRVIPMTFVMDRKGIEAWFPLYDPEGQVPISAKMPETIFPKILEAFKKGEADISLRPWLSTGANNKALADKWPTSSPLVEAHNNDGVNGFDHLPSVDEVKSLSTNAALFYYLNLGKDYIFAESYKTPQEYLDVVHALEDKLIGEMFPVQQMGVIAP